MQKELSENYTSPELWMSENSVPSRSNVDDMIETIDKLFHKDISTLQQATHRDIISLIDQRVPRIKNMMKKYRMNKFDAVSVIDDEISKQIERLKYHEDMAIETMKEMRDEQVKDCIEYFLQPKQI